MKKMIALVFVLMMVMFAACAEETAVFDVLEDEEIETVPAEAFEDEVFAEMTGESETAEITITADRDDYEIGDTVCLTANVSADCAFSIRWEVNAGNGWQNTDVSGASFSYTVDENTMSYSYRAVLVIG